MASACYTIGSTEAESLGISLTRLRRVLELVAASTDDGTVPGAALHIARHGTPVVHAAFGSVIPLGQPHSMAGPAQPDTIFLIASLTKPVTAAAVSLLIERGELLLGDPVSAIIPEFVGAERHVISVHQLLTHTSGLPDMLPENTELRLRGATLSDFVAHTCTTPLLFSPGTDCRYQSMGILLLGEIVERITGISLREFARREIFEPLGMIDSYLGLGPLPRDRIAQVTLDGEQESNAWSWNRDYWRDLGAPWGGMHSTARDYGAFLQAYLNGGTMSGHRILSRAMVDAALSNHITAMPTLPERVKSEQAWGLGWRLHRPRSTEWLPEIASERTFGHIGATGTMAWADPESGLACVLLTTQPGVGRLRITVSNAVAAIVEG